MKRGRDEREEGRERRREGGREQGMKGGREGGKGGSHSHHINIKFTLHTGIIIITLMYSMYCMHNMRQDLKKRAKFHLF